MTADPTFRMTAQEIFFIKGRGTVVIGRIESGTIAVGDEVQVRGTNIHKTAVAAAVEIDRKPVERAHAGDNVGVRLNDLDEENLQPGDLLTGSDLEYSWKP
ncbi:MAG: Elongation factor Tu [Anaerolineales bacterium]|nr:Elongation factor Tu [Anaerolineales bacterium]